MDYELFKSIIDEAAAYGPRSFSLHLFGEPLLYPRILDAIRYIKEYDQRNTILLTTNGTVLNKFAEELLRLRVDKIIWTWRRNNFNSVTKRILRKIGLIRLIIEETPKEEFEAWKDYPQVEIKHLHNYGGHIDVTQWNIPITNGTSLRHPCYHLWLAPAVRWNGDITICCNDPRGKEVLGNYEDGDTLTQIWQGERLAAIRKSHLEGKYSGLCKACDVWKTYPDMFFGWQKR